MGAGTWGGRGKPRGIRVKKVNRGGGWGVKNISQWMFFRTTPSFAERKTEGKKKKGCERTVTGPMPAFLNASGESDFRRRKNKKIKSKKQKHREKGKEEIARRSWRSMGQY